jgi:hypothetical protein
VEPADALAGSDIAAVMSATGEIDIVAVAALLAGFGSPVALAALAVFAIDPLAEFCTV